ncbi:MAG: c-type cytochrome [Acidimicrobiales bacterium]
MKHSVAIRWLGPAVIGAGVALAAALGLTAPARAQSAAVDPVVRGRVVYEQSCQTCHQADGAGQVQAGIPSLHGVGAAAVDFYVGTGRMPEADLSPQAPRKPVSIGPDDRAALVAYITTTWPGGPNIPEPFAAANMTRGGDLYRTNCSACHSATGAGAALAHGAYAPSLSQATTVQVMEAARVGPGNMPVFDESALSSEELSAVAGYVQYLRHPDDRGGANLGHTGPIAEGFVGLLVGVGALVGVAAWVGHRNDDEPVERPHD